ncbi:12687_t:CDS:2 [Dentiscutata erythropus]|uniref:12687_t:CDS:1 n=1 Tax=Dentiscutata erythropus TaxID=1348616 RepID=A0A9N8VRZ5_9GLOM|nr:12687_t:CDS:2 [Dentiscutata erythropus]
MTQLSTDSIFIAYEQISRGGNVISKPGSCKITIEKYKGIDVAVKHFDENIVDKIANELRILRGIQCENIICFYGITKTPDGNTSLIMEYAHNGNLSKYLINHKLSEDTKADMAIQISRGLRKCHEYGIIHPNLKSYNILVNKYLVLKISGFGVSRAQRELDLRRETSGTVHFAAPERICKDEEMRKHYKEQPHLSDIYSYGLVVWELATNGKGLYAGLKDSEVREFKETEDSDHFKKLFSELDGSSKLRKVIEGCCKKSPTKRMSLEEVEFELLKDFPFVKKKNLANVHIKECNYDEAIQILEDLDFRDKDNTMAAMVLIQRGFIYHKVCQYEDSIDDIMRLLEILSNNSFALIQLGLTYCFMGEYQKALENINEALDIDGENLHAKAIRGFIFCCMCNYEDAMNDLDANNESNSSEDIENFYTILVNKPDLAFWTIYKSMRNDEIDALIYEIRSLIDSEFPSPVIPYRMPVNQHFMNSNSQQYIPQHQIDSQLSIEDSLEQLDVSTIPRYVPNKSIISSIAQQKSQQHTRIPVTQQAAMPYIQQQSMKSFPPQQTIQQIVTQQPEMTYTQGSTSTSNSSRLTRGSMTSYSHATQYSLAYRDEYSPIISTPSHSYEYLSAIPLPPSLTTSHNCDEYSTTIRDIRY